MCLLPVLPRILKLSKRTSPSVHCHIHPPTCARTLLFCLLLFVLQKAVLFLQRQTPICVRSHSLLPMQEINQVPSPSHCWIVHLHQPFPINKHTSLQWVLSRPHLPLQVLTHFSPFLHDKTSQNSFPRSVSNFFFSFEPYQSGFYQVQPYQVCSYLSQSCSPC